MSDAPHLPGRFAGQVVVITGAATGIGRATAVRFGSEGARVGCLDIEDAENNSTAALASAAGGETLALHCDVRSRHEQQSAFRAVVDRWGQIDVLVTSAGMYVGGPLPDIPLDRWENLVSVNLTGVLTANSLVAPIMIGQGRGSIINISSMAGKTSWPNSAEYSATKSGVIGLTRSAAMELGPHGITVNAVCPGNTLTAMVAKVAAEIGASLDMTGAEWLEMRANDTALKRLAQPEEIAGVIAFLASADARYLTGQSIEVDGGLVLS
jgi:NAD(P)-dependent dehydrogenase (short-subunit alcohol dehydrogenase family)